MVILLKKSSTSLAIYIYHTCATALIKAEMNFCNRVGGFKVFDKMELFIVLFADSFRAGVLCLLSAAVCTQWTHCGIV